MRKCLLVFSFLLVRCFSLSAQTIEQSKGIYASARLEIEGMLKGKQPPSYERAIFLIENAWYDGQLDFNEFQQTITSGTKRIQAIALESKIGTPPPSIEPKNFYDALKDKNNSEKGYDGKLLLNYGIFRYMTEGTVSIKDNSLICHMPFIYSASDPLGSINWENTQVTNLFQNHTGNCFALVSLYKIFAERLHSDADICIAPGHVYIAHRDERGTLYNIELGSRNFPGTGTLSTLTHTTQKAIENDISLRQLNLKQSVGLCLVYLAKGYEHKFQETDADFISQCAETAIKYDSLNLNALLLKAEFAQQKIISNKKSMAQLQGDKEFIAYERQIAWLYKLGYREMPIEMKNLLIKGWTKDTVSKLATANYQPVQASVSKNTPPTRYASLSWGLFPEQITDKPIEQYSQTLFDTKKHKIVGFAASPELYNHYDFDPIAFAMNVDPLAHKAPYASPYAFCEGNPILYLDPDGRFKKNYNDAMLESVGVTKAQMQRFENIMSNVVNLVRDNPQAMNALEKTSGFSQSRIQSDLSDGHGPGIILEPGTLFKANTQGDGIHIDPQIIRKLASIDPGNTGELAQQALGVALLLVHEYGHNGDQTANGGRSSGQYNVHTTHHADGSTMTDKQMLEGVSDLNIPMIRSGSQPWRKSLTGHRGDDVTTAGFGVNVSIKDDGSILMEKGKYSGTVLDGPPIPASLPPNAQGSAVLSTLGVE